MTSYSLWTSCSMVPHTDGNEPWLMWSSGGANCSILHMNSTKNTPSQRTCGLAWWKCALKKINKYINKNQGKGSHLDTPNISTMVTLLLLTTYIFLSLKLHCEALTPCPALVSVKLCLTLTHKALTLYMWWSGHLANVFEHGHLTASVFLLRWLCHCPAAIFQPCKTPPNILSLFIWLTNLHRLIVTEFGVKVIKG